jgi:maltose O-acetyltransferase
MSRLISFLSELRIYVCNHIVSSIPSNTLRLAYYRHVMKFQLADGVAIHLGVRFDCKGGLEMHANSVINENCRLDTRGGIKIGEKASISAETIILTSDHDPDSEKFIGRTKPVVIGDLTWVGTRVLILPGVIIGQGAVVAAGAVVSKNVPSYVIVAGVPAKTMRQRNTKLAYNPSYRRLFH